jgi:transposase
VRKGRPPKFDKKVEEDLIAENQRLRAEVDYLKKLNALVLEEERRDRRRK